MNSNDYDESQRRCVEEQNELIILLLKTIRDHVIIIAKILAAATGAVVVYALDRVWQHYF